MRTRTFPTLAFILMLIIAACTPAATSPSAGGSEPATSDAPESEAAASEVPSAAPSEAAAEPCAAESSQEDPIIEGVEEGATITFWTYFLSPTFDPFIDCTIARFEEAYPGVTVEHEDHQATYLDDYRNAINAGTQPDVANLSNNEGWVREFAQAGVLLNLSENAPQEIIDQYFPNLFDDNTVDGDSFQFPWYQAIAVELINTRIYEAAGLDPAEFPTDIADIPELCQTIVDETGTLCDIRLTVNNYLSQMAYEGGVDVMNEDGTAFTFDSPEAVAWLQMYADMVDAGTVDTDALTTALDRVALLIFSAGQAAFYQTGPQLIRVVKDNNPDLYENLALAPLPLGVSGVTQPTSMAISVKADTEFPNASMALAAFFTGPRAMLDFAKIVPIYPSTPAAFDDPFFSEEPELIEDSARPLAREIIENQRNIMPPIPEAADVNDIVRQAVESVLFGDVSAQDALTDAVNQANALLP
jgi:ABC-type glycerol-3-phosphate transport system substrate-binding protein